jgi:hypothetical protein
MMKNLTSASRLGRITQQQLYCNQYITDMHEVGRYLVRVVYEVVYGCTNRCKEGKESDAEGEPFAIDGNSLNDRYGHSDTSSREGWWRVNR